MVNLYVSLHLFNAWLTHIDMDTVQALFLDAIPNYL